MGDVVNIFDKKRKKEEKSEEEEELTLESIEAKNKANAERLKKQRLKDNDSVLKSHKMKKKKK
jgi:hypothetical protein